MQTANLSRSKYNIAWVSCLVIFIGTIVYPIFFEHTQKKYAVRSIQVVPVSFSSTKTPTPVVYDKPNQAHLFFTRDLKMGDKGPDVKKLQEFLNKRGFIVSSSGNGSPGQETELFGPGTRDALKRFQETYADILLKPYGLSEGTGFFGEATRSFVNS